MPVGDNLVWTHFSTRSLRITRLRKKLCQTI